MNEYVLHRFWRVVYVHIRPRNLRLYWLLLRMHGALFFVYSWFIPSKPKNRVLIHMSVYNGEAWVEEALNSIAAQDHRNWTLMVVNDGSTDCTSFLLREFQKQHPNYSIFIIDVESNGGLWNARNIGRKFALENEDSWDWFTTLDADDTAEPDWLSTNLRLSRFEPFGIRQWNRRVDERGIKLFDYPACDQTFWSKRAIRNVGFFDVRIHSSDSDYMRRAELEALKLGSYFFVSPFVCQKMLVHEHNHSKSAQ